MMKIRRLAMMPLILGVTIAFNSCKTKKEEANIEPNSEVTEKKSGYVLRTQSGSANFVTYYDKIPSGDIDNSKGKSFQKFSDYIKYDNYFMSIDVNAGKNLSKIMFNNKGEAFEKSKLSAIGGPWQGIVKDEKTAYTYDFNDASKKITVFDPSTMKNKGKIDISKADYDSINWGSASLEGFVLRGDELFVSFRAFKRLIGLATNKLVYHIIDTKTNTFKKSISFPNVAGARREGAANWVDEKGNIYVAALGNKNLPHTKPTILKIPAGSSDFDKNYNFKPVDKTKGAKVPIQIMNSFSYYKNGKAYANISTSFPSDLLLLFKEKPDFGAWTNADKLKALGILNKAANGQYVEIDLVAKTVKILEDIPGISPFNSMIEIEGDKIYMVASNTKDNAVYEHNPSTGKSKKLFNVTNGGAIKGFYKIGK